MGNLIADIFITIKPTVERLPMTVRSLQSLREKTERLQYRLTVCLDGNIPAGMSSQAERAAVVQMFRIEDWADYTLQSHVNEGLGPTINRAIAHIKTVNDWHSGPMGDPNQIAPYIVMCQDDILYTKNWLPVLASRFNAYGFLTPLGFATGHYAPEHSHTLRKKLGEGVFLQDWIRATHVLGTRQYWERLMPIPALDPETGRLRAKPNDGMGSGVDWWMLRNHENSVCKTGRTNLVMPGLVVHMGYDKSTWLDRELPESDSDKEAISR